MEKPIRFTLRIVTSLDKALTDLAKAAGQSKTGLITQILWEYVRQQKKPA
ncbi:hypothetical protein TAMA11512_08860 [Selenomonas sp. TAMA-11512]|nr:hypothetical protein TAMA11512_08860 [Selenomonas sp. TAMA-11512]